MMVLHCADHGDTWAQAPLAGMRDLPHHIEMQLAPDESGMTEIGMSVPEGCNLGTWHRAGYMASRNMEGAGSKGLGVGSAAADLEGMVPRQRAVSTLHMGYWKVFLRGTS